MEQEENLSPKCSVCGKPATTIRLLHQKDAVRFVFAGICGGNGNGDRITTERAAALREAFSLPYTPERVALANLFDDAGFCRECLRFYCRTHWNISPTGGGHCPEGHFKSLDPHWSPEE